MDSETTCYGGGSIAGAIFGTLICGIIIAFLIWWLYKKYQSKRKGAQLVIDDPENVKNDFAFDNPAFKNEGIKTQSPLDTKWMPKQNGVNNDKRKTVDDTYTGNPAPRMISLRGSDFTGLGIEICGGLKEGIFVKKVSSRGPAADIVNIGDRITSITIDFRHIVQEDAISILSYASPYNVQLELIDGKGVLPSHISSQSPKESHSPLSHPLYRSSSQDNLDTIERNSRKKLFPNENDSNYPTLKMDEKPTTTVHKENEKEQHGKKNSFKQQIKDLVEEKLQNRSISPDKNRVEMEKQQKQQESPQQKSGGLKFGIRVLPPNVNEKIFGGNKSPSKEKNENENNQNLEKNDQEAMIMTTATSTTTTTKVVNENELKVTPPTAKRRSKDKINSSPTGTGDFQRDDMLNSSGIKRDANGIPQEIPNHMLNAAVAAKDNRKSINDSAKKSKGKAPKPPPTEGNLMLKASDNVDLDASTTTMVTNLSLDVTDHPHQLVLDKFNFSDNFVDHKNAMTQAMDDAKEILELEQHGPSNSSTPKSSKKLNFEPIEDDKVVSHNQFELNSDHITIHQASSSSDDDDQDETTKHANNTSIASLNSDENVHGSEASNDNERKTASLGDLSRFNLKLNSMHDSNDEIVLRSNTGTLERAQSLEISDSQNGAANSNKKRKATISDTDLLLENKEPRLDMLDSGMDTLQRNRLKGAYEFGTMEDVINRSHHNDNLKKDITEIINQIADHSEDIVNRISKIEVDEVVVVNSERHNGGRMANGKHEENIMQYRTKDEPIKIKDVEIGGSIIEITETTESRTTINGTMHQNEVTTISLNNGGETSNVTDNVKIIKNFGTTNISDDVKVSRYPFGSLERPKSDVLKKLMQMQTSAQKIEHEIPGNVVLETQPISLTLIGSGGEIETSKMEKVQDMNDDQSPVYSSDNQGVNSISISSMEFNIVPSVNDMSKHVESIITISTDPMLTTTTTTSSQPNSIIMIEDEKLDFTLQTPPDMSDNEDEPQKNDDVFAETDPKTFVTEITVKSINGHTTEKSDNVQIIQNNNNNSTITGTATAVPKATSLLTNFMANERQHSTVEENFIPRNSEIRFTTSTYEPSVNKIIEKRNSAHIDQIRSNFEQKTMPHSVSPPTEIVISSTQRKSSIPTPKSPSKIPVFNSSSNNINLIPQPKIATTQNNSNNSTSNNSNSNTNSNRVSVSVTSIKNSSRHPSDNNLE